MGTRHMVSEVSAWKKKERSVLTIYEIDKAIMDCINEDGEVIDIDAMESLQMERAQKIENVGCWIKNLKADCEAIKAEEKTLRERREVIDHKVESLQKYLEYALQGQKFSTPRIAISYRKSVAVDIPDEDKIPAEWYKATYSVDKAGIKEALQKGKLVVGATLIERQNMQIK